MGEEEFFLTKPKEHELMSLQKPDFVKYKIRVQETLYMDSGEKKKGRGLARKAKKSISDFYMDIIRPVINKGGK